MKASPHQQASDVSLNFLKSNDLLSIFAFLFDYTLYFGAVATAILASALWLKILASVVAGTAISMLFILGHDAAHKSLVANRKLNKVLGRLTFLPCLHNYTLWVLQHNRLHHQSTNVKGLNSYSPFSLEEFKYLSPGRKGLERIFRSPFGFGLYYLLMRWWNDKFFPRKAMPRGIKKWAWIDFTFLCAWALFFILSVVAISRYEEGWTSILAAVFWGVLLPFLIWNQLMGTTAFLQHTHPLIPWFRTVEEARAACSQEELTILVRYPAWYDLLSHNIMQHQAHHINPRIPWFRLKSAQSHILNLPGSNLLVQSFGLRYLAGLTQCCQLYDYSTQSWLTFAGERRASNRMFRLGPPNVQSSHELR
jgi:omega-6 fatty acid desaturase (delta-12 desaturase)